MKSTGIALCAVLLVLTSTALAQGKRLNADTIDLCINNGTP